jgi:hypothetical protein
MHDRASLSTPDRHTVTPPTPSHFSRKRGRKPDKSEICHLVTVEAERKPEPEVEISLTKVSKPAPAGLLPASPTPTGPTHSGQIEGNNVKK